MPRFGRLRGAFCIFLVLGLAGAPLSPVFAGVANTAPQAGAHIDHTHGGDIAAAGAESSDHAGCAQHDECSGSCCSACAHCVLALPGWSAMSVIACTSPESTVSSLFSEPPVASLPRPPQSLS